MRLVSVLSLTRKERVYVCDTYKHIISIWKIILCVVIYALLAPIIITISISLSSIQSKWCCTNTIVMRANNHATQPNLPMPNQRKMYTLNGNNMKFGIETEMMQIDVLFFFFCFANHSISCYVFSIWLNGITLIKKYKNRKWIIMSKAAITIDWTI